MPPRHFSECVVLAESLWEGVLAGVDVLGAGSSGVLLDALAGLGVGLARMHHLRTTHEFLVGCPAESLFNAILPHAKVSLLEIHEPVVGSMK